MSINVNLTLNLLKKIKNQNFYLACDENSLKLFKFMRYFYYFYKNYIIIIRYSILI